MVSVPYIGLLNHVSRHEYRKNYQIIEWEGSILWNDKNLTIYLYREIKRSMVDGGG